MAQRASSPTLPDALLKACNAVTTPSWTPHFLALVDTDPGSALDFGLCTVVGRVATVTWKTVTMKLGFSSFVTAAVAAAAAVGVVADCPDYTSFSQVCYPMLTPTFLADAIA